MGFKLKPTTREERVQRAARQMKIISILFVLTAIGTMTTDKYLGNRKYFFVVLFISLALLLWRQGKPEKLKDFAYFDKEKKDSMF